MLSIRNKNIAQDIMVQLVLALQGTNQPADENWRWA